MIKRIVPLLLIAFLLISHPALAADAGGNGTISGSLVNQTSGTTSSVAAQTVTLNTYQGNNKTDSKTVKTDDAGKYVFNGLSTDAANTYEVDVTYQGADYYSDPIQFAAGETTKSADIAVYDTTTSDDALSIMLAHAVVLKNGSGLLVSEYYYFANTSDRAFIGKPGSSGKNETVKFSIPPGATDFQIAYGLTDSELIKNGNNFTDTVAVTPAGREISFIYTIPLTSDKQSLTWNFNYDLTRFDLLATDPSIKISGSGLTQQQPISINGKNYQDYSSEGLSRGGTLSADLSNLSATGSSSTTGMNWVWLALIPVVLIIGGVGFVFLRRRKSQPVPASFEATDSVDIKEKLLAEIAELDDNFENGKIEENEYSRLRSEKKRKLVTLMKIQEEEAIDTSKG